MKPLNTDERKSSFLIFLAFFIISMLIVVLAAFFGMQVPIKQNELLKTQVAQFQKEEAFKNEFAKRSEKIKMTIDLITEGGKTGNDMDQNSKFLLDTLKSYIGLDTSSRMKVYNNFYNTLFELRESKETTSTNNSSGDKIKDLTRQLKEANDKYEHLRDEIALKANH